MSKVLVLTGTRESAAEILPSLSLLDHVITVAPASADSLRTTSAARAGGPETAATAATTAATAIPDAVLVDARYHLVRAKELLGQLSGADLPILAIISEGAWVAITAEWGADDVILHTAGPGEVEARIRLAIGRAAVPMAGQAAEVRAEVRSGELVIDEATYSARIRGVALDLTFKEFELLKFLAQHPRRVFTRSQLLAEVWGYEYFGGTRTVDVHVRRLRAKLGSENEALIGTVRNVGYKFVPARPETKRPETKRPETKRPETKGPEAKGPEAKRLETKSRPEPKSPAPKPTPNTPNGHPETHADKVTVSEREGERE